MEQQPTSFDDLLVRGLEEQYRKAVAKVFIHNHGDKGWTGFLVNLNPCVVVTVAHLVRSLEQDDIYSEDTFYVKFHADPIQYRAKALKCRFQSDLLILQCERPTTATFFRFGDHTSPLLSSTSILCISHPAQRDWTILRGAICRTPFEIGEQEAYDHNMILFDHDAQCFPGSSGDPIIDLMGRVIGMQFSEFIVKEHGLCVRGDVQLPLLNDYEGFNVSELPQQVNEFPFLPCNVKQAITVQYLAQSLRELFQDEGVNFDTDLNSYVRRSAMINVTREAR